jgi:hypothetical protein
VAGIASHDTQGGLEMKRGIRKPEPSVVSPRTPAVALREVRGSATSIEYMLLATRGGATAIEYGLVVAAPDPSLHPAS